MVDKVVDLDSYRKSKLEILLEPEAIHILVCDICESQVFYITSDLDIYCDGCDTFIQKTYDLGMD